MNNQDANLKLSSKGQTKLVSSRDRTAWIAKTAILSALSIILMYLEFPIPLMPVFLKFDFADLPALLAAFSIGPGTGVLVQLIRNIAHLPASHTFYTGELANFLVGGSFVFVAGMIYRRKKTKRMAIIGLTCGGLVMTIVAVAFNYYVNIPFYSKVMNLPLEGIISMVNAVGNTLVHDLWTLLLFVFVPFNILKSLVISIFMLLIYKKLSPLLHR
ncbi:MAG: ECF transporter S component [Eubacteriales bacterium]|nr:ECF transporter S component [Eubacteriales bacterium]